MSYLATTTCWSDSFRNAGRIASGMLVGFKSESWSVSRRNGGRIHAGTVVGFIRNLHIDVVSIGSLNQSIVHPRSVFMTACLSSSASLVCVHNHPSGDPTPSSEDIAITRRLKEAGELMGIKVLDHVIIGDGEYVSFVERGLL